MKKKNVKKIVCNILFESKKTILNVNMYKYENQCHKSSVEAN